MPSYDMNQEKDSVFYLKLLRKKNVSDSSNFNTFRLMEYAQKHNLTELIKILGDVDLYIDRNELGEISGLEIITFYDDEDDNDD